MKATHSGTCQLCGRLQKLPGGRLSKHGYTVQWGFFEGTCPGAGHLPYELGANLIEERARWAEDEAARLASYASHLRQTLAEVWVHEYVPASWRGGRRVPSSYVWRGLRPDQVRVDGLRVVWEGLSGKEENTSHYEYGLDEGPERTAAVYRKLNGRKADEVSKRATKVAEYSEWLRERLSKWAPAPDKLVPVS